MTNDGIPGCGSYGDARTIEEQLRAFAERGLIAPESLSLQEIRLICEAYISHVRHDPERYRLPAKGA